MPVDLAAKLMNKVNPGDTGGMHGMLPLHLGMRIRLLEHLDLENSLAKDAEGDVVHIAINPEDENAVREARAAGRPAYLRHLPCGVGAHGQVCSCPVLQPPRGMWRHPKA